MFYIHFLFLALPGEKEAGWGWRRFKRNRSHTERHLISYLCRSIAGCKTKRVLKGNSLVSPPWCGYLVHIFGIFDCSYSFGTWSLVHIWHRKGEEPPVITFWRHDPREPFLVPCMFISVLHWSLAATNSMVEAKRTNLKWQNSHHILLCLSWIWKYWE